MSTKRATVGSFLNLFYAIGGAVLGLTSFYVKDYRTMLRILYTPALFVISYVFFLPRSVRWLVSKKRFQDVGVILKKAAKINKVEFSRKILDMLETENSGDSEEISKEVPRSQESLKSKIVWRVLNLSYCWFTVTFVYYGLNLNSVYLNAFNKHFNFIFSCLVEIPAYLLTNFLMDKIGRRKTMFFSLVLSGILCVVTELVNGGNLNF